MMQTGKGLHHKVTLHENGLQPSPELEFLETARVKLTNVLPNHTKTVQDMLAEIEAGVRKILDSIAKSHEHESKLLNNLLGDHNDCLKTAMKQWPEMAGKAPLLAAKQIAANWSDNHDACRAQEVGKDGNGGKLKTVMGSGSACSKIGSCPSNLVPSDKVTVAAIKAFQSGDFWKNAEQCSDDAKAYEAKVGECTALQQHFETSHCSYHEQSVKAGNACLGAQHCQNVTGARVASSCAEADDMSKMWKTQEQASQQVLCLIRKLKSNASMELSSCSNSTNASKQKWSMSCPQASDIEKLCSDGNVSNLAGMPSNIALVPGNSEWVTNAYSNKGWWGRATNTVDKPEQLKSLVQCKLPVKLVWSKRGPIKPPKGAGGYLPTFQSLDNYKGKCEWNEIKDGQKPPHRKSVAPSCTGGNAPFTIVVHVFSKDNSWNCPVALGPSDTASATPYATVSLCTDARSLRVFLGGSTKTWVWSPSGTYERWPKNQWEVLGLVYTGDQFKFYGVHASTKVFKQVSEYTFPKALDIKCEQMSIGNGIFKNVMDMNNGYCLGFTGDVKNAMYWDNTALTKAQIQHWMKLGEPGTTITQDHLKLD